MEEKNSKLPQRIVVIRTSAMGDVAMMPHAIRALKGAYPNVEIIVATRPLFRPFFDGLDVEFLDVDIRGKHRTLVGMWRLATQARAMGIDAVADLHGVRRSQAFRAPMWLRGINVSYIRKDRGDKRQFIKRGGEHSQPLKHTVTRYCDVFRRLGFVFDDPKPIEHSVRTNPMGEKQGQWVGFAPFSAQRGKSYPESQSREAIALLSKRFERVFIHSGGEEEAIFAQQMEKLHPNVTALWGRLKLAGEVDLIANLDCVVSMDSMVMHLASLVGTPVVSVWGATHPGLGFLGYGCDPRGVLQANIECRPCSVYGKKSCRFSDYRCMAAITPKMVVERLEQMILWNSGKQKH